MRSSIETKILAGFCFAIIVFFAIGVATYRNVERLVQTRDLVPRTQKTENALKDVLTIMTDAETGQRGFVITNDPAFLEPMDRAKQRLEPALAGLKELLGNNSLQSSSFDALQEASRLRMAAIVEMVALRSN